LEAAQFLIDADAGADGAKHLEERMRLSTAQQKMTLGEGRISLDADGEAGGIVVQDAHHINVAMPGKVLLAGKEKVTSTSISFGSDGAASGIGLSRVINGAASVPSQRRDMVDMVDPDAVDTAGTDGRDGTISTRSKLTLGRKQKVASISLHTDGVAGGIGLSATSTGMVSVVGKRHKGKDVVVADVRNVSASSDNGTGSQTHEEKPEVTSAFALGLGDASEEILSDQTLGGVCDQIVKAIWHAMDELKRHNLNVVFITSGIVLFIVVLLIRPWSVAVSPSTHGLGEGFVYLEANSILGSLQKRLNLPGSKLPDKCMHKDILPLGSRTDIGQFWVCNNCGRRWMLLDSTNTFVPICGQGALTQI